jgi:hypothetical protein
MKTSTIAHHLPSLSNTGTPYRITRRMVTTVKLHQLPSIANYPQPQVRIRNAMERHRITIPCQLEWAQGSPQNDIAMTTTIWLPDQSQYLSALLFMVTTRILPPQREVAAGMRLGCVR